MAKTVEEIPKTEPFDPNKETIAHALGIEDKRAEKLHWILDEIMEKSHAKADAIREIAKIPDASIEEKTYLGYLLCKRIVFLKTPTPARKIAMAMYKL